MVPRVSVVINNFNYARFLARAIDSVLAQDYPPGRLELVVVDDGSTDGSRAVLRRFGRRARPVLQENQGQAGALNAGIRACRGDIICLLDSDDWWRPDKVRLVVERFEQDPPLGMVQHWSEIIGVRGRRLPVWAPRVPPRYSAMDFLTGEALFATTSGMSFRRGVLERMAPIPRELRICADTYLAYAVLLAPVGNIAEKLGSRSFHGQNRYEERHQDPERLEDSLQALSVCRRELESRLAGGLGVPESYARRMRLEELEDRLFLSRYRARFGQATRHWLDLVLSLEGPRRVFKPARLLLALARPDLYLWLQRLYYGRQPALARASSP